MKWLADEDVAAPIVHRLRDDGHEVLCTQADLVAKVVRKHGSKMLDSFTVISYSSVRIRSSRK